MKKQIRPILFLLLVFVVIAFLLNVLILLETPNWISGVVGEGKDWLLFWSSYIAAIGTFLVIYINIRHHNELVKLHVDTLKYNLKQHRGEKLMTLIGQNLDLVFPQQIPSSSLFSLSLDEVKIEAIIQQLNTTT